MNVSFVLEKRHQYMAPLPNKTVDGIRLNYLDSMGMSSMFSVAKVETDWSYSVSTTLAAGLGS